MVPTQKVPSLQHFRKTEKEVIGGLCRCVLLLPLTPSTIAAPGQPARDWRACAHAWPALPTPLAFLRRWDGCSPRAWLAPLGDPPPSERRDPEWPWPLLSAAGGPVATFVNCKQTHVVLQQSRPCLMLVAFPPALPPPPSRGGFLPLPASSRSVNAPLQMGLGGSRARVGPREGDYNTARRGSGCGWGGGEPGGVRVCRERGCSRVAGLARAGGRTPRGSAAGRGTAALGTPAAACWLARLPACARALFTSEAWT